MKLGEKIRYLREVEGSLRGLGRPMTQQEMVQAIRQELRKSISQSYLSQIENGARPHMTQSSRALLAKFFKVHPGFLVDDPEGYHTELTSDLRTTEGQLDVWLLQGSERFVSDPEVSDVLIKAAREKDTQTMPAAAGCDSRHAGFGRASAGSVAAGVDDGRKSSPRQPWPYREGRREENPMNYSMTWADFYLDLFRGRLLFQFLFVRVRRRAHGPAAPAAFSWARWGRTFAFSEVSSAHGPVTAGHAPVAGDARAESTHAHQAGGVSPFNFVTLTAFLAWFGGTGYLLTRYSGLWVGFGLLASVTSGLVGGGIVFLFLSRVLISDDENMDPADYEMVGVLGRVSSPIREGGTGEIIYTQMGTRRVCGARSDDNSAIAKGTEVVVTRYEKGIAYVRLWSEMSGE